MGSFSQLLPSWRTSLHVSIMLNALILKGTCGQQQLGVLGDLGPHCSFFLKKMKEPVTEELGNNPEIVSYRI